MSLLTWKDAYSVGFPDVDHEHRELIDLINELHRDLDQGEAAVEAFLHEIGVAIGAHFALEERRMREIGYPEYREHKLDHERLLEEIRDIADGFTADPGTELESLGKRLNDWFGQHFRTFDARLHRADPH